MTWIKLDDRAPRHPKVAGLSDKAFRWWVLGLCYSSEFLTDGSLPKVFWKQAPNGVRSELVSSRLWDWIDPHFIIHDYHHHQSTREDVEYEKQRNRDKAAAYRAKKRGLVTSVTGDVTGTSPGGGYRLVPNPENREQRTDTDLPPKSPADAGDVRVLERHKRQAKKVLDAHLGYCQHVDPCADRMTCVNQIAVEIARAS